MCRGGALIPTSHDISVTSGPARRDPLANAVLHVVVRSPTLKMLQHLRQPSRDLVAV